MEKFGVEEKTKKTVEVKKTAEANDKDKTRVIPTLCPWCKRIVEDINVTGGILICPEHGTEPFE